jgi:hypothetical protein
MSLGTLGRAVLFVVCAGVLLCALVVAAWAFGHIAVAVLDGIANDSGAS